MVHHAGTDGDGPSAERGASPPTGALAPTPQSAGRESAARTPVWNPNRADSLFHHRCP